MKVRNKVDTQWITAKMSEMIDINPKEKLSKGTYAKKISMDKLQPFCRDVPEFEIAEFIGGTKFRNGDTIMARITPCLENGKTAMVNILEPDEVGFGSTEFIVFRAKEGCMDPDFVYYLIKSPIVREPAIKSMVGSSGRQRVQTEVLQNLVIPFPSLSEQRKIGSLLKTLDDKIAINTKINNNLEQQAFALFDSLFTRTIDGSQTIGDYINPKRGRNLLSKDAVYGTVPVVAGGLEPSTYHNVANTKAPVLTISASGANAGFVNLWLNPVWSSDSSYIDSSMTPNVFFWYILLKGRQKEIFDAQTGSAQPHIYPQHIAAMPIGNLNQESVSQFTTQVAPLFELIGANKDENERLRNIRDALLPRLMSGEIDVTDICI